MDRVHLIDHPLVQNKMTLLRDKNTGMKEFRELVGEIAMLTAYEATRDLELSEVEVETPVAITKSYVIGKKLAVIPILRAGIGMVDGILRLLPTAKVGHIGLYRDPKTLDAVQYYCKLPGAIRDRLVLLLDPMLATGHSAVSAVTLLKRHNVTDIRFVCLIAAPQGIHTLSQAHPDVEIFTCAVDKYLNEHCYIVPGLGDAGDRLFGTK